MACGDKYADLLVTVDGATPSDPCTAFCGLLDYGKTRDVVVEVADEVLRRWNYLLSLEAKTPSLLIENPYPQRNDVKAAIDEFLRLKEDVPHPLVESFAPRSQLSYGTAVEVAWRAARAGVCAMEWLDKAAVHYGATPLASTTKGPKAMPTTSSGGMWVVAAAAIGAYVLIKRRRNAAAKEVDDG